MSDPFETLSLPARPWLNSSDLQARFHALASQTHPDANTSSEQKSAATNFSEINEAHRALSNPVSRLEHLLNREAPDELEALQKADLSLDLSELFMKVATLLREANTFHQQQSLSLSPVSRAVIRAEHLSLKHDLDRTLKRVDDLWHQCEQQIQAADSVWDRRTPGILRQLATVLREMKFLQRWRVQLREARFQMTD